MAMERFVSDPMTISVHTADLAQSEAIPIGSFAGGSVEVVTNGITALAFYGCTTETGTYVPLYDASNVAVTRTVAHTRGYALPEECYGWRFIKMLSSGSAGTVRVTLKT